MEKQEQYDAAEIDEVQPEEIDLDHLAWLMLNWGKARRHFNELEDAIKDTVLVLGKTQNVGYVRATYSKPRKGYDYEGPVQEALESESHGPAVARLAIAEYTRNIIDYRAVCKRLELDPIVTEGEGPGSVTVKLLK